MRLCFVLLVVTGCSAATLERQGDLDERGVPMDEAGPAGFSGAEVVAFVGTRTYPGVVADSATRTDVGAHLTKHGAYTVSLDVDAAQSRVLTESGGRAWLVVDLTVQIASEDHAIDVAGPARLIAREMSDDHIVWTSFEGTEVATGTLPSWVADAAERASAESICGRLTGDAAVWTQAQLGAILENEIGAPSLAVGMRFDQATSPCDAWDSVERADLSMAPR